MHNLNTHDMLVSQVADLNEKAALSIVKERMGAGHDPFRIIESCQEGVRQVGLRYEEGRYFITGLIMAGVILKGVIELIRPDLQGRIPGDRKGNIVLGTVQGDIHDIGKNLGNVVLSCEGFNVIDVGVDVPAGKFVEAIKEHKPGVVGLSCLLTTAFDSLKETIGAIEKAGLRSGLSIIIGGSMVNETVCEYSGADYWTTDAVKGAQWCNRVIDRK